MSAQLPCGCDAAEAAHFGKCLCTPENITERGTFLRSCRACQLDFEGIRTEVVYDWLEHARSPEHARTWALRSAELRGQDQEQARQVAGLLW